jgi:ABC-type bacteriocin/lantibiotic exporter with double-glycine peptidase domain
MITYSPIYACVCSFDRLQIFTDFNLSVPAGSTVALVGQSGSGKSTGQALT